MSVDATRKPLMTGGCQCGTVRYALYTAPSKVAVCHCRMCQRALGAPFGVFAVVDVANFAWTRGQPASWQSSSRAFRDFCSACGTPLAFRPIDLPIMEMMAGSLDDPTRTPPTYQVGIEAQLPWVVGISGLPCRTTDDNMGTARAAAVLSFQHSGSDTDS